VSADIPFHLNHLITLSYFQSLYTHPIQSSSHSIYIITASTLVYCSTTLAAIYFQTSSFLLPCLHTSNTLSHQLILLSTLVTGVVSLFTIPTGVVTGIRHVNSGNTSFVSHFTKLLSNALYFRNTQHSSLICLTNHSYDLFCTHPCATCSEAEGYAPLLT